MKDNLSESQKENLEIKGEELKDKKNSNLFPSEETYTTFQNFFNNNKGIEALWKNVENNENKSKVNLYNAETKILELVKGLAQQLDLFRKALGDRATNKHKDDYNEMVKLAYAGHEKEGKNFLKKFPNWSFNLSDIISTSNHYRRISNAKNFEFAKFDNDFKKDLDIKFNRKDKTKLTNLKGKAGNFLSSIGKFFKNFGKNFTGKASKSGVEKKVQAFFKRLNAPWRRWWEFICDGSQELSQKSAKQNLKKILDNNDDQNAKKVILKFFISPNDKTTKLSWEISDETNNISFSDDNDKSKINLMFRVFKSLDKELGTKVEALFNGAESAKNLDTNDDKIKRLLELYETFIVKEKAIKFNEVCDKLGIKTNGAGNADFDKAIDDLFTNSNYSDRKDKLNKVKALGIATKEFFNIYNKKSGWEKTKYELLFFAKNFKTSINLKELESVENAGDLKNFLTTNNLKKEIPIIKKIDDENNSNIVSDITSNGTSTPSTPQNEYKLNELNIDNEFNTKKLGEYASTFLTRNFKNGNLVKCIKKDNENFVFISEANNFDINKDMANDIVQIGNLQCIGITLINDGKLTGSFKPNVEIKNNIVTLKQ